MFFNKEEFNNRLQIFSFCEIDKHDALWMGKHFHLFPHEIKAIMVKNQEFYGISGKINISRTNGLLYDNTTSIPDVRNEWLKNKILSCPPSCMDRSSTGHFIYIFDNFIESFVPSSIKDLRDLYHEVCKFVKKYAVYSHNQISEKIQFDVLSSFVINDILEPCFKAGFIYYKYILTKEEFTIYSSFFRHFYILIEYMKFKKVNEETMKDFGYHLCTFYDTYGMNTDYINGSNEGMDPFLMYFIHSSLTDEDKVKRGQKITLYINLYEAGGIKKATLESAKELIENSYFFENISDVSVNSQDFSGTSDSNVTVFGDTSIFRSVVGNMDNLKMDLLKFNSEMVKSYINKGDDVKVNFVIDEQLKMYLQAELNCKMLVANINVNNENNMITILNYEDDNFVLFTVSDDMDTLYGLSLNEDHTTKERKLITIDKDEDLNFQFVINLDEE